MYFVVMFIEGFLIGFFTTHIGMGWFNEDGFNFKGAILNLVLVGISCTLTTIIFKQFNLL